jgi:hypothetical protein
MQPQLFHLVLGLSLSHFTASLPQTHQPSVFPPRHPPRSLPPGVHPPPGFPPRGLSRRAQIPLHEQLQPVGIPYRTELVKRTKVGAPVMSMDDTCGWKHAGQQRGLSCNPEVKDSGHCCSAAEFCVCHRPILFYYGVVRSSCLTCCREILITTVAMTASLTMVGVVNFQLGWQSIPTMTTLITDWILFFRGKRRA